MKWYIAGPMSGVKDLNFPAFHAAAKQLRAAGLEVVSPAEINAEVGMPWAECMRRDIPELLKCTGIAMLPGWQASRGATLEHHIAVRLGMAVATVDSLLAVAA